MPPPDSPDTHPGALAADRGGRRAPEPVLYDFRRASFLTQFTLWAVLGVVLAELVGRLSGRTSSDRELADVRG